MTREQKTGADIYHRHLVEWLQDHGHHVVAEMVRQARRQIVDQVVDQVGDMDGNPEDCVFPAAAEMVRDEERPTVRAKT
jgi:hypothetical protein